MPMLAEVRHEVKLVLDEADLLEARARIATAPQALRRQHPTRDLCNIYFDTEALDTYWANHAGASERHKVRLRWYGDMRPRGPCRFEVKRKAGPYGWKLVHDVPAPDLSGTWPEVVRAMQAALPPGGRRWLDEHGRAVLINRYRREYYASFDGRIRVTLDSGNTVYDQLHTARPNLARPAPPAGLAVLEGKAAWQDRDLLELVLQHFPFRVTRNSKYLNGVDAMLG